ncbi:MAG: TolC family protein [Acidobacteria bacterium]|nr:TolC family protein [Acidobacteriota bacterium]MCI0622979.1 TolC family protein [Acidobacteriota bacterium]MCI0724976.1 TolC family protein [Acidobacteriota bacterium]
MKNPMCVLLLAFLLWNALGHAQSAVSLSDAVERAQKNYPAVQVSQAQVDAAVAGIRFARTSYLPRFDSLAQVNRATRNNIYGMLLQQSVISPISGPPVIENTSASVFGSAVGLLVDWEPFDFGLRHSRVEFAESTQRRAEVSVARTQFEAGTAAADSYLTVLAAQETVKAARASVERGDVLLKAVEALVQAQLRPGADATVARAELAGAQAQVVRSEQAVAEAKALLAGLMGEQGGRVSIAEGRLLDLPGDVPLPETSMAQNPLAREQNAAVEEARARARTLDNFWAPRFSLQATSYARGTGVRPDSTGLGGANGLAPTFYNWGLGFTVRFPILDFAPARAQQAEESARIRAEEGRYRLVLTELDIRRNRALAAVDAARKLAALAPMQLDAARAAETQAQARYRAGLATLVEVADAQRVLAQAEIDNGLARLNVWRGLLALRVAEGDLAPLLQMAGP